MTTTAPASTTEPAPEAELLQAARDGDELAFASLIAPRRAELHAHCYRMLGSVQDAEDALQDALLRVWRGLPRFEGRSSLRVWLFRITTNACLDALGRRATRTLPSLDGIGGESSLDPAVEWLEPYPVAIGGELPATPDARYEQLESVELAFVAALQHLPPNERAVLLLRDVLGFSAKESAALLQTTTAAANSALQRARRIVDGRLPAPSQQEVQRLLGEDRVRSVVDRYMDAMRRGDVDGVIALLTADSTWTMPPQPEWYQGEKAIAEFLVRAPLQHRWRHLATRANGQPAVAGYWWDDDAGAYVAHVLAVLTLRGERIAGLTAFLDPVHIERLGLPSTLPEADVRRP